MKIFGVHLGYDEPFWYYRDWEFAVFDNGWVLSKGRVIRLEGSWPTYWTVHPIRKWRRSQS